MRDCSVYIQYQILVTRHSFFDSCHYFLVTCHSSLSFNHSSLVPGHYINEESAEGNEIENIKLEIQDLEIKRDQELAMNKEKIKKNILKQKAKLEKTSKDSNIQIQELKIKRNQELSITVENLKDSIETLKIKLFNLTPLEANQPPFS